MTLKQEEIGEICGIFAGDGSLDKTKPFVRIYIDLNEEGYAHYISILLSKIVKRPVKIRRDTKNVFIVYVFSQKLVDLLKKYLIWGRHKSRSIRLKTLKHSTQFIKGFIRGLLDTDGCTNRGSVEFNTVSKQLNRQVSYFLKKLGFEFKVCEWDYIKGTAYKIFIKTVESKRLVEFVIPRNPKRYKLSDTLIDHHEEQKILELRKAGKRVYDIAKLVKRSHASVSKILLKHEISKPRTTKDEAIRILKLWKRGFSRKEISKITGKTYKVAVWTILKRSNLLT